MTGSEPASEGGFVHATALVLGEDGIVIFGPSGAGKSSLALALIEAAPAGCFARLVGDDRVRLTAQGPRLIVEGHPRIRGQIERRGYGVAVIAAEPCAVVRLIVELGAATAEARLPPPLEPYRQDAATVVRIAVPRAAAVAQVQIVRAALARSTEM